MVSGGVAAKEELRVVLILLFELFGLNDEVVDLLMGLFRKMGHLANLILHGDHFFNQHLGCSFFLLR